MSTRDPEMFCVYCAVPARALVLALPIDRLCLSMYVAWCFFIFLCDFAFLLVVGSYDGEITLAALTAFEEKFGKGELTPSLKSEEPADEDTAEPVKVVKGKSFSKMVLDNGESQKAWIMLAGVGCWYRFDLFYCYIHVGVSGLCCRCGVGFHVFCVRQVCHITCWVVLAVRLRCIVERLGLMQTSFLGGSGLGVRACSPRLR